MNYQPKGPLFPEARDHYRKVWTDQDIENMNARTAARRRAAIAELGHRWVGYINRNQQAGAANVEPLRKAGAAR